MTVRGHEFFTHPTHPELSRACFTQPAGTLPITMRRNFDNESLLNNLCHPRFHSPTTANSRSAIASAGSSPATSTHRVIGNL